MVMSQVQQLKVLAQKENGIATQLYDQVLDHDTPLEIIQLLDGNQVSLFKKTFSPRPIVTDEFPISNFKFYWNSDFAFSKSGTYPSKLPHPDDPVVLFSNASSVKNHTIKDGFCEINSGGGNGRIYLELYRIPAYQDDPEIAKRFRRNLVLMTNFVLSPKSANLSIKYGNHGTTGYLYNGKTGGGLFGQAVNPDEISSKAEFNHDQDEEKPEMHYPFKPILKSGKEYRYFTSYISDPEKNTMTLNSWLMFDIEGEKKWYHVMNNRVWEKNSHWDSYTDSLPSKFTDTKQIQAGPAMVDLFHVWLRANKAMVKIRNTYLGTVI